MESFQSKFFKVMLKIVNLKKIWEVTGDELRKNIEKKQSLEDNRPPKKIQRRFNIIEKRLNGYFFYEIKPLKNASKKHIFYIHGGGFVYQVMKHQWRFLGMLIDSLQCTITVPIYPLAPKYHCKEVFDMLMPIYQQIVSEVKADDLVIMGDSAGGGMSLSLSELLKENNLSQPGNIILISPTLDMSFSNPEISDVENLDLVSAVPALIDITKWYACEKDSKNYLVSPIYGDIEALGKISLFIGTHDIFYPDAKKFKKMADKKGVNINYYEYPFMIHGWPLFFFPESKKATKQIIKIIKS